MDRVTWGIDPTGFWHQIVDTDHSKPAGIEARAVVSTCKRSLRPRVFKSKPKGEIPEGACPMCVALTSSA